MRRSTLVDFEARLEKVADNGCWNWTGRRLASGYGDVTIAGRKWRAHRYAYQALVGPIGSLHVLHKCDNPACCNPSHLFFGTPADNAADKSMKGRTGKEKRSGEMNSRSKLTDAHVRSILSSKETGAELARQIGVSRTLVNMVRRRVIWSHVND